MTRQQIVNAPFLYINNLKVAVASNTTLTIGAGICRDSTNAIDLSLTAGKTINAAVNGANGLDTGSLAASKVYAVLLIGDSSGYNSPVGLISLSATAPTLPTGYDVFRRIGWAITDGSTHFLVINSTGTESVRECFYDEPASALSGGTSATFAAVDLSNKVPAVDLLPVKLQLSFTPNAANDTANVRSGGSSATNGAVIYGSVAAKVSSQELSACAKLVTDAPTIEYKVTASGSLTATVLGFVDYL